MSNHVLWANSAVRARRVRRLLRAVLLDLRAVHLRNRRLADLPLVAELLPRERRDLPGKAVRDAAAPDHPPRRLPLAVVADCPEVDEPVEPDAAQAALQRAPLHRDVPRALLRLDL